MKTIIVGIGNPILRDDGAGIHVLHHLKQTITDLDPTIAIEEAFTGGMNLLEIILGYDKAILIDTIQNTEWKDGDVKRCSLSDIAQSSHSYNPHDVSLQEALILAEQLGEEQIPKDIVIIGIVVKKTSYEFGEQLSKPIAAAVPKAVAMTLEELKKTQDWSRKKFT